MIDCPDCGSSFRGVRCSCGYTVPARGEVLPHIECAYGGCPKSATIRVRQGSATANVCRDHYERYHVAMAKRCLAEHGVKAKDDRTALLRKFANAAPPALRKMIEREAA